MQQEEEEEEFCPCRPLLLLTCEWQRLDPVLVLPDRQIVSVVLNEVVVQVFALQ